MVVEHGVLEVVPGSEDAFEEAFEAAKSIIAASSGFRSLRLGRCVEERGRYLLIVEWDRIEDHTEGFRGSEEYQTWKKLLHHFYEPFPTVDHYDDIVVLPER
jgi:heme-degrading monooxygenase HmoA